MRRQFTKPTCSAFPATFIHVPAWINKEGDSFFITLIYNLRKVANDAYRIISLPMLHHQPMHSPLQVQMFYIAILLGVPSCLNIYLPYLNDDWELLLQWYRWVKRHLQVFFHLHGRVEFTTTNKCELICFLNASAIIS